MSGAVQGAMQSFAAQMAAFQALLLAASAIHKAANRADSLGVMRRFAGVPQALAPVSLFAATALEAAAAGLLVTARGRAAGAVLAVLIWSLYAALIIRAVAAGRRDVDCGCSFGAASGALGSFQIARNLSLGAVAACVAVVSARPGIVAMDWMLLLGGSALLALYVALDQVMALKPLRGGEVL